MNEADQREDVQRFGAQRQKFKGTLARPLFRSDEELLLFLALLLGFFLGCHVSILPFHCSWMSGS
jgi:hypothetical protein